MDGRDPVASLAEAAFGYPLAADELAWFEAEFRRTRALMRRARERTPNLDSLTPEDFARWILARGTGR